MEDDDGVDGVVISLPKSKSTLRLIRGGQRVPLTVSPNSRSPTKYPLVVVKDNEMGIVILKIFQTIQNFFQPAQK